MIKSLFCICFVLLHFFGFAQNNENRFDNFYFEAGGAGLFYSLNFERAIPDHDSRQIGAIYSAGLMVLPFKDFASGFGLLGTASRYYNVNKKRQFIGGLGASVFLGNDFFEYDFEALLYIPLTYKYTFPNNRMYVGGTLYGIFVVTEEQFLPWAGLRVGYNFNMKCKYCKA